MSDKQVEQEIWEDEKFLIQVELQSCEELSRYEDLMRRLDKIMEKE